MYKRYIMGLVITANFYLKWKVSEFSQLPTGANLYVSGSSNLELSSYKCLQLSTFLLFQENSENTPF